MSRAGRTRKTGPRHPSGQLKRLSTTEREAGDRITTARQPHRRVVAAEQRTNEEAESPLGRLWLKGYLKMKGDADVQAARDRYDAGTMFAQTVGAYLSVIEAPGGTAGSGRKSSCQADLLCAIDTDECRCFAVRGRYTRAYEALAGGGRIEIELDVKRLPRPLRKAMREAKRLREDEAYIPIAADRRRVVMAVTKVAIHRDSLGPEELVYLVRGLELLRQHFGLTMRRKPKQY